MTQARETDVTTKEARGSISICTGFRFDPEQIIYSPIPPTIRIDQVMGSAHVAQLTHVELYGLLGYMQSLPLLVQVVGRISVNFKGTTIDPDGLLWIGSSTDQSDSVRAFVNEFLSRCQALTSRGIHAHLACTFEVKAS